MGVGDETECDGPAATKFVGPNQFDCDHFDGGQSIHVGNPILSGSGGQFERVSGETECDSPAATTSVGVNQSIRVRYTMFDSND